MVLCQPISFDIPNIYYAPLKKGEFMGGLPAWEGGPDVEVRLYEVIQGDHSWATKDMDTETEVWNFFKKYIK